MIKDKFTVGIFAIIFDSQKRALLCHRRDYDFWNLPGGGLEKGEAPWESVVREVKEETGLDVKPERIVGVYSKPEKDEIVFSFACKITGGNIKLTEEADKIEYFNFNKIPKNTSPKQVARIKDALEENHRLILKTQKGKSSLELIKEGKL